MYVKTIKVSEKGQIAIPLEIRNIMKLEKGDELVAIEFEGKLLLEKSSSLSNKLKDDFTDVLKISQDSLKDVWENKEDDVWSVYLNDN